MTVRHTTRSGRASAPGSARAVKEKVGTLEGAGLVALGAALGAGARAGVGLLPLPRVPIPTATLLVNLAGAFLLGLLYSILDGLELAAARRRNGKGSRARMILRLLLGTGVMGGLTTYSTFILEVDLDLGRSRVGIALAYGVGSLLAGWAAVFLGDLLGRGILRLFGVGTLEPESETVIDEADADENAGDAR